MATQKIMNITEFKKLLSEIGLKVGDDYQVWLSSDEEGNEYLPMSKNIEMSLAIDQDAKRIILFPMHH